MESLKLLNALGNPSRTPTKIYALLREVDECLERTKIERKSPKTSILYHLSQYVKKK
jgi:hypothetical protein